MQSKLFARNAILHPNPCGQIIGRSFGHLSKVEMRENQFVKSSASTVMHMTNSCSHENLFSSQY